MTILFISSPSTLNTPSRHFFTVHTVSRDRYRESNRVTPFLFSLFFLLLLSFFSIQGLDSWKSGVWDRDAPLADGQESGGGAYFLPTTDFLHRTANDNRAQRPFHARTFPFPPFFSFLFFFLCAYIHTRRKHRARVPTVSFVWKRRGDIRHLKSRQLKRKRISPVDCANRTSSRMGSWLL